MSCQCVLARVSSASVLQECQVRECQVGESYKSAKEERPTRVSSQGVPQECRARMSHKSFKWEMSNKSALQKCQVGSVKDKGLAVQDCQVRVSYKSVK